MRGRRWGVWSALALLLTACAPAGSGGGASVSIETLGGSIRVDWAPVDGASAYRVYWSGSLPLELGSAPFVVVGAPPFVAANLSGTYHVVVQPLLATGDGPPSAPATVVVAPASPERYFPPWADVAPTNELALDYDPGVSSAENALALESLIGTLQPGDVLRVGR